jgi:MFS family permease
MPKGFYRLVLAQFLSGLADNALMILGIFFLQEYGYPGWWSPLLKFSFTLSYVALASVVGPVADAFCKGRLMAVMNLLKLAGVLVLLSSDHPLLGFAIVGMAAAFYAPAKYAMVTESVPPALLVKANAWLEVSVVLSVLLGVALGGWLTGLPQALWQGPVTGGATGFAAIFSKTEIGSAFMLVCMIYLVSALINAGLRGLTRDQTRRPLSWRSVQWAKFWHDNRRLWADPLGGFSLFVTTLCWGVGGVLQFAVLAWAQEVAGLTLKQGAYLQALVAIGVIIGAIFASRIFQLTTARRTLPWGLVLSALLPCLAFTSSLWLAIPILLLAGCAGGMLLVPMNALLQHRGQQILSSGRSIAVQGFNENLSILIMVGVYSGLVAWHIPLFSVMLLLTLPLLIATVPGCWKLWKKPWG